MNSPSNPYSSPSTTHLLASQHRSKFQVRSAVFFFLLATAYIGPSIFYVAICLIRNGYDASIKQWMMLPILGLCIGFSWLTASCGFWQSKYQEAAFGIVMAIAVHVIPLLIHLYVNS